MNKYLLIAFTLVILTACDIAYAIDDPIVYSRCERTTDTYTLTADVTINSNVETRTKVFTGLDVYDVLPDVTNFFGDFSVPCDLVYRDAVGDETIIYNCSATSTNSNACAALDPTVSFDGKTIAFSVFKGTIYFHEENIDARAVDPSATSEALGYKELPNKLLRSEGAHLHFYNLDTGITTSIPYEVGVFDSGPAFISEDRIAFTSTRDGNASTQVGTSHKPGTRIWAVDITGDNMDLSSHHSLSQEQHPIILKDGRLAYTSWQIFGGLPFRHHNGSVGGATTLDNLFHIYSQNPDGSHNFPLFGQHSGDHKLSSYTHGGDNHNAGHFIAQTGDGRIWFADYYRGNNNGLGTMIGFMPEPPGQEGQDPHTVTENGDKYLPNDVINLAFAWSHNNDRVSTVLVNNPINSPIYPNPIHYAGKLGHPGALTNNELMVSWGKGSCSINMKGTSYFQELGLPLQPFVDGYGSGVALSFMSHLPGVPACDAGIYRVTTIPSVHPSDLELIVDSPDWHEIMARAVVPYTAIHGVEKPEVIPPAHEKVSHVELPSGTPFGLLGAASIIDRETHPRGGITFDGLHQFHLQGTDTIDYADDDLCGVRMLGVIPNRYDNLVYKTIYAIDNVTGERVSILGEVSVKNRDANGVRMNDPSGSPDTSFLLRMPANVPYLMQAIDCDGRTLNTDQTWQSLRPGEMKTCGGCHVHARPALNNFEDTFAATNEYTIPRLGEGLVPLLTGLVNDEVTTTNKVGYGIQIDFERDVLPIFQNRCASCHGETDPEAGLILTRSGTSANTTWWCLVRDKDQSCVAPENVMDTGQGYTNITFGRPQLTRYVRAMNSLGSLLYWKAANQRTDNRLDSEYTDDIDFGASHPTSITYDELGVISRWIDVGSPGGDHNVLDLQRPTLNIIAVKSGDAITGMKIGISDLGSGADPSSGSLTVGGSNVPISLINNDVADVTLSSPITDPDTEIVISVNDMAGNNTTLTRTASFFLNLAVTGNDSNYVVVPIYDEQGLATGGSVRVKLILEGAIPVHDALRRPTGMNVGAVVTNE